MARPKKEGTGSRDSLVGAIVYMRSALWGNGEQAMPAIVTRTLEAGAIELDGAAALVSVTVFVPGAAPWPMDNVRFYDAQPAAEVSPAAWAKE